MHTPNGACPRSIHRFRYTDWMSPRPENQPGLREQLTILLAERPSGLTINQIAASLRPTHALSKILDELSALQQLELVRFTGARYRWIGPPPITQPPEPRHPPPGPLPTTPPQPPQTQSRWDEFRRLCRYYAEFVRLEERSSVRVYANKENREFVQLTGAIDWLSLEAGHTITTHLPIDAPSFASLGTTGNRLPYWFLGLPVDIYRGTDRETGETWTSLEPILIIAVEPKVVDAQRVELTPLGPMEVNPGWLQRRFQRKDQRVEFLATIGLLDEAQHGADDDGEDEVCLRLSSFRIAVQALLSYHRDWWREYGSVDQLVRTPPLGDLKEKGLYNRAVLVSQPRLKYGHRLHAELSSLADPTEVSDQDLDGTALAALFPHTAPPQPSAADFAAPLAAEYQLLNDEQRTAVEAAQHNRLTVLTGPPGTGKSVVVAHVMANMALARRSVLFASRNHQAIEAVEPKLNAMVEPETLVLRPARPWGQEAQTANWQQAITQLLGQPAPTDTQRTQEDAREQLAQALRRRQEVELQLAHRLDLADRLGEAEHAAHQATQALTTDRQALVAAFDGLPELPALDSLVENLRLRDQPTSWWRQLWHRLRQLLGTRPDHSVTEQLTKLLAQLATATGGRLPMPAAQLRRGMAAELEHLRPFLVACLCRVTCNGIRKEIEALPTHEQLKDSLDDAIGGLHGATVDALRRLAERSNAELSPQTRQRFAEIRAALINHDGTPNLRGFEQAFRECLDDLLRHFPLWAVSNLSAHKAMPLSAGRVELLILDEASQCDIPSVVPLLFRTKRALIVGDPMQLGHITTMQKAAELRLRNRFDLANSLHQERFSAGSNSIYDLAASSQSCNSIVQLKAHYRCHPQIAGYFNNAFYKKSLRVMTNTSLLRKLPTSAETLRACEWSDVRGDILAASAGCHSPAEITEVVRQIGLLQEVGFQGTVGVVTPFRVQANRINDAVTAKFSGETLDRMRFLSHTVDGFQGDERDVILFSLCAGPGMPDGSRGFLASAPNRFNVAISRGKACVRVIGNRQWAENCGIGHITSLLAACQAPEEQYVPRKHLIGPVWEPKLAHALQAAGIDFRQQYPTCGYYLDFALVSENARLDIEVDGEMWHRGSDGKRLVDDLYRDHALRAAGWEVLRFWVYELKEDIDGCIHTIRTAWQRAQQRRV
jgi:very-short-patch-repair endonuclease